MEQELQKLRAVLSTMAEQLRIQNELLAAKDAQIAALTEKIAELTAILDEKNHKKNSGNSSTPPSNDRFDKPAPKSLREKSGRLKKGKIRSLLERFRDFKEDILRFAKDWRVPFTNNDAEGAIRFARVKEKVSGCFRTKKGADQFACTLSFISTAVAHGVSSFDACLSLHNHTALMLVQS